MSCKPWVVSWTAPSGGLLFWAVCTECGWSANPTRDPQQAKGRLLHHPLPADQTPQTTDTEEGNE